MFDHFEWVCKKQNRFHNDKRTKICFVYLAASSKKPSITHEDVNSIFLNSEIILFLHQIFYKGLSKKLENWPTFYTGKLT